MTMLVLQTALQNESIRGAAVFVMVRVTSPPAGPLPADNSSTHLSAHATAWENHICISDRQNLNYI